jgi:hypothetical protein
MNGLFQTYKRFEEFISPGVDRFSLLCSVLRENNLNPVVLETAGKRHIVVGDGSSRQPVILAAHYDRVEGSPGANDNSAAVFMLIEAARELCAGALVVFTDKEELSGGEGIEEQGAYSLALYLKEQGRGKSRVYCFDACGAGDTLIVSTAADHLLKNREGQAAALCRRVQALRSEALRIAREARIEKVLLLPTPFSDDAGFLRAGIAAQTITVLPQKEAAAFASLVRTRDEAASSLVSGPSDRRLLPETWRSLNGPGDSPLRLTAEHWKQVVLFAQMLFRA